MYELLCAPCGSCNMQPLIIGRNTSTCTPPATDKLMLVKVNRKANEPHLLSEHASEHFIESDLLPGTQCSPLF